MTALQQHRWTVLFLLAALTLMLMASLQAAGR